MEEVDADPAPLIRSTYVRIWEPLASGGRMDWSDEQWKDELSIPGIRTFVARVDGEIAGFAELGEANADGDSGIVVFGLVPELQGKGFGAAFLTFVTEMAWRIGSPTSGPTKRVWLMTSSGNHPHALPNYERRGFRIFDTKA